MASVGSSGSLPVQGVTLDPRGRRIRPHLVLEAPGAIPRCSSVRGKTNRRGQRLQLPGAQLAQLHQHRRGAQTGPERPDLRGAVQEPLRPQPPNRRQGAMHQPYAPTHPAHRPGQKHRIAAHRVGRVLSRAGHLPALASLCRNTPPPQTIHHSTNVTQKPGGAVEKCAQQHRASGTRRTCGDRLAGPCARGCRDAGNDERN